MQYTIKTNIYKKPETTEVEFLINVSEIHSKISAKGENIQTQTEYNNDEGAVKTAFIFDTDAPGSLMEDIREVMSKHDNDGNYDWEDIS